MDEAARRHVKRFHLRVALLGGVMMVLASLAAAYVVFLRRPGMPPYFLVRLGRFFR